MIISVDDIIQTSENSFYTEKSFSIEKDQFLADHIINGEAIFPGAMMLELMAECGHLITPSKGQIILEKFQIFRKIRTDHRRLLKVFANCEAEGIKLKICADFEQNGHVVRKNVIHAQALYKPDAICEIPSRHKFKDNDMQCFSLKFEDIYTSEILNHGSFFQGLSKQICLSDKYLKGLLINNNSGGAFLVEPVLVDNFFQLGSIKNRMFNSWLVLPVGIEQFCFLGKLMTPTAICYGVLERNEDQTSVHNFIVCDEFDNIIIVASGVHQKYAGKNQFNLIKHFKEANERLTD